MLGTAEILAPVIATGKFDVLDDARFQTVQPAIQNQLYIADGDDPAGLVLENAAPDIPSNL